LPKKNEKKIKFEVFAGGGAQEKKSTVLQIQGEMMLLFLGFCASVGGVFVYPAPGSTPASPDYYATVSGQPAFVFFTSRRDMQPVRPGDNVPQMTARNTSFFGFSTDGPATVVITVLSAALSSAQLYPLRAAAALAPLAVAGQRITLALDGPRQVCLVVNGITDAPLCIFADPPETYTPSPGDPGVVYFGAGTHAAAGVISVGAGQTVYLAPGAHVFGRVEFAGDSGTCSGVAVRGRGVLDGHNFTIDSSGPSLVTLDCSNALLEGVTMLNSPKYHLEAGYSYTTVRWVKAIAWGYSTDGLTGGSQSLFEASFLKVNDDSLKPFGVGTLATDIVLWQMENGCAVMGSWNLNQDTGFVTARRLDVIRHERNYGAYNPDALLCFLHGGSGHLYNYLFDDIRVDMAGWAAVQVFVSPNPWAHPAGGIPGSISASIVVRNFSSASDFLHPQPVQLQGFGAASTVSGVTLDGMLLKGRSAAPADVSVNGSFATMPAFCKGCSEGTVGDDWTPQQKCSMPDSWCKQQPPKATPPAPPLVAASAPYQAAAFSPCPSGANASFLWNLTSDGGPLVWLGNQSLCLAPSACTAAATPLALVSCSVASKCLAWHFDTFTTFTFTDLATSLLLTNPSGSLATAEPPTGGPEQQFGYQPSSMLISPVSDQSLCLTSS